MTDLPLPRREGSSSSSKSVGSKERLYAYCNEQHSGVCDDCHAPLLHAGGRPWASINLGALLCLDCSGSHRALGVHVSKVLSVTMDDWSAEMVAQFLRAAAADADGDGDGDGGDGRRPPYECVEGQPALTADASQNFRNAYVRTKYTGAPFKLENRAASVRVESSGVLIVTLVRGEGLKAADPTGKSDPFIVMAVGKHREKSLDRSSPNCASSKTINQNLNPVWNETLMLNIPNIDDCPLTIQCWDYDVIGSNDNLGVGYTNVSALKETPNETKERRVYLSKKGFIDLYVCYQPL